MSAVTHCAFILFPTVVDGPGVYLTRGGRKVTIDALSDRATFGCSGSHDCGTRDSWNKSGRLFPGLLSDHDLVQKLSA